MPRFIDSTLAIKAFMQVTDVTHQCKVCKLLREMQLINDPKKKMEQFAKANKLALSEKENCLYAQLIKSHVHVIKQAIETGRLKK